MAGSKNDVVVGKNADFSQTGAPNSLTSESNGLVTDGQMWIGSTALNAGSTHINVGTITSPLATLTIGYSSPNITLDVAGGGGSTTWNDTSGAFSPLKDNGYFVTATATGTLPASPSQGDTIKFFVDTTQILTIQASGTQIIRFGSAVTAAGGTAVSTARGDSVELTYRSANTCWESIAGITGVWTLT